VPAVLAVICAFMAGMALGSWLLDRPFTKFPNRSYALLESIIGFWGIVIALLIGPANQFALRLIGLDSPGRQWVFSFGLPLVLLLPATICMGASFPAMERCTAALRNSGRTVPGIYAVNTFGAVAGTLCSIFLIAPALELRGTLYLLATINLLCGAVAFLLSIEGRAAVVAERDRNKPSPIGRTRLAATLALTGFLGIGFETVCIRVLSQVLENTVYTFAAILAVFLLGTSVGAAAYQRVVREPKPRRLNTLLCLLTIACVVSIFAMSFTPAVYAALRSLSGQAKPSAILAEISLALFVFGLPTMLMGATFSELVQSWRDNNGGVGRAAAINTAGAALAPIVFNLLFLPLLGSRWTLVPISLGYFLALYRPRIWHWVSGAFAMVALVLIPLNLHIIDLPPNGSLLEYREGVMASVAVVEDATRNRTLRVNNHFQMGGTGAAEAEYRHAHIPLLLHPAPRNALVLGVGTGITLGAATLHPEIKAEGVELLPEVLAVMPEFEPFNHSPQANSAVLLHAADARRFVKVSHNQYDVIIADLFHPAQDGAGTLYTLEQFAATRNRLAANGLFCQWLPLHQLDGPTLKVIVSTFLKVFPETQAYLLRFNVDAPVLGLIGLTSQPEYGSKWIEQRLSNNSVQPEIRKLALADSIRFFGNLVAGAKELRRFSDKAQINLDDRPVVMFRAPEFAYEKTHTTYGRLVALLDELHPDPAEALHLTESPEEKDFGRKLSDYFAARAAYIHGLVAQAEDRQDQAIDGFVESARLSDDFTPGYAQCLTLASLEARSNPGKARALLERLVAAQPSRPVAQEMLKRLFP